MPRLKVLKSFAKPKARSVSAQDRDKLIASINALTTNWRQRLKPWPKPSSLQPIRLISDCAGYGSDLIALRLLGLRARVQCVMMSECNPAKVHLHQAVEEVCGFDAAQLEHVSDMSLRDNSTAPSVELYVAGYPCPSFSRLGKQKGTQDSRGMITIHGLAFIAKTRPLMVVLEQVSSLLHRKHKRVWEYIQKTLRLLNYKYFYKTLNTRQFVVPQSRPRVYVLAVAAECCLQEQLQMPVERKQHPDLHTFLDKEKSGTEILSLPHYERQAGPNLWKKGYVVDIKSSDAFQHLMKNCCPCLTFTRCREFGYYIPKLRRRLNTFECARLQGLPDAVTQAMLACCREESLPAGTVEASIGDAMSINVLMLVLRAGLDATGLSALGRGKDYWIRCPADSCRNLSNNLFSNSFRKARQL